MVQQKAQKVGEEQEYPRPWEITVNDSKKNREYLWAWREVCLIVEAIEIATLKDVSLRGLWATVCLKKRLLGDKDHRRQQLRPLYLSLETESK